MGTGTWAVPQEPVPMTASREPRKLQNKKGHGSALTLVE